MVHQASFQVRTHGRGTSEITHAVADVVAGPDAGDGVATVFVHHTSASLVVCENADPTVQRDLDAFLSRLVPDGDPIFRHVAEGADDMPAHVRAILTQTSIQVPVRAGRLDLGTWQGLYLYEHRTSPHPRRVSVTVVS